MKYLFTFIFGLIFSFAFWQSQKTKVLTLGTFHFAFQNLDVKKIARTDQIDVLEPRYQLEIEDIVNRIAAFKPTIIAIEKDPALQTQYDSIYNQYLQGKYELSRSEVEQIGFRLAKMIGLKKLHCVNDWGRNYEVIDSILNGKDTASSKKFMEYFYRHSDTSELFFNKNLFKNEGILADLRSRNDEKNLEKDLGNYLIGVFKYETADNSFFGADFTTGWWFNRNLRIFRNVQKLDAKPADRILVIYGVGHMNLLNLLFKASPEYDLLKVNDFLK